MKQSTKIFKPTFSDYFNLWIIIPSCLVLEIIFRMGVFNEVMPMEKFPWKLGPTLVFLPIAAITSKIAMQTGFWEPMKVIIRENSIEGPESIRKMKTFNTIFERQIKLQHLINRKDWYPRVAINFNDIDWDKSFKKSFFNLPGGFGIFQKIHSVHGNQIYLHWAIGDKQIKEIKETLLQYKST